MLCIVKIINLLQENEKSYKKGGKNRGRHKNEEKKQQEGGKLERLMIKLSRLTERSFNDLFRQSSSTDRLLIDLSLICPDP